MQVVPRLINNFIPTSYELTIKIYREKRSFSGLVTIIGKSKLNSKTIRLHSKALEVSKINIDGSQCQFSFGENDELIINKPENSTEENTVSINFTGKISGAMHGLYPCYYKHKNKKKELLATQFESHHAREVFPCVDEPEAKATFDLTLITETDVTVLGNMPIKIQKTESDDLITTFETTPKMSVYLLAWVVGELQKLSSKTKNGVEINVWSTPAQNINCSDFALDIAIRTTDYFDEYFDTPYPLPKCDHVALPDFACGAMENWGLITYREATLLVDPTVSSISSKRYVATVIAHEISHQWFGNLITMKWWDDLWLNESFATLIEYVAIDAIEPSWEVWFEFITYNCMAALKRDSLSGVQPIRTDVNHPDEISMLFDGAIVYAKGARVLQMMQHYIGDQAFRAGLKEYFKKHAYKNTQSGDLWDALGKISNKDIKGFMDKWLDQPGYPVLHVSKTGNIVSLSQERLSSKSSPKTESLWPIPLNSNCPDMPEVFLESDIKITTDCDIIRFNLNNYGHYVTHYDDNLLNQTIGQLKQGQLSPIDRLQLLNDQRILASVGIISHSSLITLLKAFENETSEPVWDVIGLTLGELKKFVEYNETAEKKLKQLAGRLAQTEYQRLGWIPKEHESESDTKLRSMIIGLMLFSEDQQTIDYAKNEFAINNLEKLDPELRPLILSTVVRYSSDESLIDNLINTYRSTVSSELMTDICAGLTSTRDKSIITKLLNYVRDNATVRPQDVFRWVFYLFRNKYSRDQTWEWVKNNWGWIENTFSTDKNFDDFPRAAAAVFGKQTQLDEYISFFKPLLGMPALNRVINVGINEITDRVNIIEQDGDKVQKTLLDL